MGRPLFYFVAKGDEALVHSCINAVKCWGVDEHGRPSDAGFGFGRFHLFPRGRDSVYIILPDLLLSGKLTLQLMVVSDWSQDLHSCTAARSVRPFPSIICRGRQAIMLNIYLDFCFCLVCLFCILMCLLY